MIDACTAHALCHFFVDFEEVNMGETENIVARRNVIKEVVKQNRKGTTMLAKKGRDVRKEMV